MEGSNSRVTTKYGPNRLQVPSANNLISVVYFIAGAYGWNFQMLAPIQEIWLQFLADRTLVAQCCVCLSSSVTYVSWLNGAS